MGVLNVQRCNKLRNESFPFDSIIYSFEGDIDCFENNFINFFPKLSIVKRFL